MFRVSAEGLRNPTLASMQALAMFSTPMQSTIAAFPPFWLADAAKITAPAPKSVTSVSLLSRV